MKYNVLGVGFPSNDYGIEKQKWAKYGACFEFVDTIQRAITLIRLKQFKCIVVCSAQINEEDLTLLRRNCLIPVVIMPSEYSVQQRQECAIQGLMQHTDKCGHTVDNCNLDEYLQDCISAASEIKQPLTIISAKDLCFCLEYRTVEIRGQEINLTAKEFDILSLLICNQRQVFTYDMIVDRIWNEIADCYSKKTVATHISNLRRKLKIEPDVPNYIKSVHGIGYKFNAGT